MAAAMLLATLLATLLAACDRAAASVVGVLAELAAVCRWSFMWRCRLSVRVDLKWQYEHANGFSPV